MYNVFSKITTSCLNSAERKILDWLVDSEHEYGGWCLKDRGTSNGIIPEKYMLKESEYYAPEKVIEKNIIDSHGVLVFSGRHPKNDGSLETENLCDKHGRPVFVYELSKVEAYLLYPPPEIHISKPDYYSFHVLKSWGIENRISILYVKAPKIQSHVSKKHDGENSAWLQAISEVIKDAIAISKEG